MCTIIIVMSSVRVSYCNHSRYDSATIAAHASFGSSYFATCWANKITNWHLAHSAVVASQPLAFLLRHNQLRLPGLHVVRQRQTTGETTCRRILSCNFRTKRWNAYHSTFKNVQNEHTIRASRFQIFDCHPYHLWHCLHIHIYLVHLVYIHLISYLRQMLMSG